MRSRSAHTPFTFIFRYFLTYVTDTNCPTLFSFLSVYNPWLSPSYMTIPKKGYISQSPLLPDEAEWLSLRQWDVTIKAKWQLPGPFWGDSQLGPLPLSSPPPHPSWQNADVMPALHFGDTRTKTAHIPRTRMESWKQLGPSSFSSSYLDFFCLG